jgi:hypothetical protein
MLSVTVIVTRISRFLNKLFKKDYEKTEKKTSARKKKGTQRRCKYLFTRMVLQTRAKSSMNQANATVAVLLLLLLCPTQKTITNGLKINF